MAGWDRTVHGGIVSTVLDEIMGWGVIYLCKKLGVTKKITVEFIKPIFADDEITVVGNLEKIESGRSVIMSSQIYNSDSVLCATSSAEFKALDPKIALRLGLVSDKYMRMFEPILNFNYDD
jgi:acyl-coenzyme A thioesterase PaaI-like protein